MSADLLAVPRAAVRVAAVRMPRDARIYQIAFLAALLGAGAVARDLSIRPEQFVMAFVAGIGTQLFWLRRLGLARVGVLSAVITCFGLSILLRADSLWVHPLAASAAISAKFMLRIAGKHLFNPANLGVVAAVGLAPGAWVSAGQWGADVACAGWVVALGAVVASRAERWDTSWAFLACYLGLVGGRVAWLGQDWAVLVHQLQSGALLLFAFFMISDPMTTPNHRAGRLVHAGAVATIAFAWQYALYRPNGLLWALLLAAPLVPLADRVLRAERFKWRDNHASPAAGAPAPGKSAG